MCQGNKPVSALVVMVMVIGLAARADCGRQRINVIAKEQEAPADWQTEAWFGRKLAARILGSIPLCDCPAANRYLNLVGSGLALYAPAPGAVFTFGILDSEKVNAYATPGGYIFVTKGAILRMRNEAELAAVLGHEIAHVSCHHMVKSLGLNRHQDSAVGGMAVLVGGTTGSFRQAISQGLEKGLEILFDTGYSRKQELEADRIGMQLAVTAGYRKDGLVNFLKRIHGFEASAAEDDRSHPTWKVRLQQLEASMDGLHQDPGPGQTREERFNEAFAQLFDSDIGDEHNRSSR